MPRAPRRASASIKAPAPKPDPRRSACPSRDLIELLASKWVLLLVPLLRAGPRRNSDLLRGVEGISQKMLTQTLRALMETGLVKRQDYHEVPPRVEYTLTRLGRSLAKAIGALDEWVIRHASQMPGNLKLR
jgi:DNA-binding HxlR family transcriptional regulator